MYLDDGGSIPDLLDYTVSCYSSDYFLCGRCMSCFRRWVAEVLNDIYNTAYNKLPLYYYYELMEQYNGFWKKLRSIFTPEFWINLPSNIDAYRAIKKYKLISERLSI